LLTCVNFLAVLKSSQMQLRQLIMTLVCLILLGQNVLAYTQEKYTLDNVGKLNTFSLSQQSLLLSREGNAKATTLYTFSQEATAFNVITAQNYIYLVFVSKDQELSPLFFALSKDKGKTFSRPVQLAENADSPYLAIRDESLAIVWQEATNLAYTISENRGETFFATQSLIITNEALTMPRIMIDQDQVVHLALIAQNNQVQYTRILYAQLPSFETTTIFQTADTITSLGISLLPSQSGLGVYWQNSYLDRSNAYLALSLDNGKTFGNKPFYFSGELALLQPFNQNLIGLAVNDKDVGRAIIELPQPEQVKILSPNPNMKLNATDAKIVLSPPTMPLIFNIELTKKDGFARQTVSASLFCCSTTQEIEYELPEALGNGTYDLKVTSFDGVNLSQPSNTVTFTLDRTAPKLLTFEAERVGTNVVLTGQFDEAPFYLALDNQVISTTRSTTFAAQVLLDKNDNRYTLAVSDEAGNTGIYTQEVFFNLDAPQISLISPTNNSWFKPGAIFIIEAEINDLQNDLDEQNSFAAKINDQISQATLSFDATEKKLFGFISLPNNLPEGKNFCQIIACDKMGNQGQTDFSFFIDSQPPCVNCDLTQPLFLSGPNKLLVPLLDTGAGIDPCGTLIKAEPLKFDQTPTMESGQLLISSSWSIFEGSYEATITPRDLVGNCGEPIILPLIADFTPPQIILDSVPEAVTNLPKLEIKGSLEDNYPDKVMIYNNHKIVQNLKLESQTFATAINLVFGNNEIVIKGWDKAGNEVEAKVNTNCSVATNALGLINNFVQGPNPFSPQKKLVGAFAALGKGTLFSYSLAQPARVTIRIFDITGTQIWLKTISGVSQGVTAWGGTDQLGTAAGTGLYPYMFSVSAGGVSETRRGKIIITN